MQNDTLSLSVMKKFKDKWRDRALKAEQNERALRAEIERLKANKTDLQFKSNNIKLH